jgi:hypothetical protein
VGERWREDLLSSRRHHARREHRSVTGAVIGLQWRLANMAPCRTGRPAADRGKALLLLGAVAAGGCQPEPARPAAAPASTASGQPATATAADAGPRGFGGSSQLVTWTCTGSPCPWGSSLSNHALVWPAAAGPSSRRLGYSVSAAVYLTAARANGADIALDTGTARVHAGPPGEPTHPVLAALTEGQTFHVTGLAAGEVLSVQADLPFRYRVTLLAPGAGDPRAGSPRVADPRGELRAAEPRTAEPQAPEPHAPARPTPVPSGPPGPVIRSIPARWRCHKTPGCFSDPWPGSVIAWPAWAAHQDNGRTGNVLRFVYSTKGEPLYPYMGPWAHGCEVTAVSGTAKVVEWKRGAEQWRETVLEPGESHVISLAATEDGALIEGPDDSSIFSVSLRSCTPERLQP